MDKAVGPSPVADDILFTCPTCSSSLVVAAAAAGAEVSCQNCSARILVPQSAQCAADAVSLSHLELRLKENESQRTEVTSYINQLCIQLHRWKLRLQTLNERKAELEAEMASLSS